MPDIPQPMVSICCLAYNHEDYIRDALEGFLMQKTTFPFEVLIHDDASTDHTADIIREYEAKYPEIIKPIYQKENQYSKGVDVSAFNFNRVQGKYIAMCEGDDFWCDPNKLQIQYDFMEAHPDYSLCMHDRYALDYLRKSIYPIPMQKIIPEDGNEFAHFIALGYYLYATQTMFFSRNAYLKKEREILYDSEGAPMGDCQLVYHLALAGKVKILRKYMAVYRKAAGSASNYGSNDAENIFYEQCMMFLKKMVIRSGHEDWWKERTASSSSKNTIKTIYWGVRTKLRKYIHPRVFRKYFMLLYGKFLFQKYLSCSPSERCRVFIYGCK